MKLSYHYENLEKHGVTPEEVDEILVDPDKIFLRRGKAVLTVGKTFSGRILEIGINESLFVYHAMDASKFCYKFYKRKSR
ncbi:MAG: hypothetical protein AB1782_06005 [Cyanobacteriota bacterium]